MKWQEFKGLLIRTIIDEEEQTPFEYLLKNTIKGHFYDKIFGNVLTLTDFYDTHNDIDDTSIKINYVLSNGEEGLFLFDYDKLTFALQINGRFSYVPNQFWLFKTLIEWGYIEL